MTQKRALVAKKIQTLRREARNKAQSLLGKKHEQEHHRSLTFDRFRHLGDFAPLTVETPPVLHRSPTCWFSNPGVDFTYHEASNVHGY